MAFPSNPGFDLCQAPQVGRSPGALRAAQTPSSPIGSSVRQCAALRAPVQPPSSVEKPSFPWRVYLALIFTSYRVPSGFLSVCTRCTKTCSMARFNYGGLVSGGTGRFLSSLGGMVLMKNGVVRAFVTPANPQTTPQMNVRSEFSVNTSSWQGLTEAQRLAWDAAAASGTWTKTDPFTGTTRAISSGKLLFMFVNQNIVASGAGAIQDAPTQVTPGTSVVTAATFAAGAGTATFTYTGALNGDEVHLVTASPAISAGNMKVRRAICRSIGQIGTASPSNIAAMYTGVFGTLTGTATRKVFLIVEAVNQVTGQRRVCGVVNDIIAA